MKTIKGSILTLAMIAIAMGLAGGNVWYQRSITYRTQVLWGNDVSLLIAAAPRAELLRLGPATQAAADDVDVVVTGGVSWPIVDSRVMAGDEPRISSPGFSNLRHSLRQNASYVWDERAPSDPPVWKYALRFTHDDIKGQQSVAILLFNDCGRIERADGKARGQLIPRIAKGLVEFAEEKLGEAKKTG